MYAKRKFSQDDDDSYSSIPSYDYARVKQVKLELSFTDDDVAMNDAPNLVNAVPFPSYSPNSPSSDLSDSPSYSLSSLPSSSTASPSYPEFELYPEVQVGMDVDFTPRAHHHSSETASGLLQPSASSGVLQHGERCTQIPRLRMSSHPGLNGTRTMWSHCQSCGAIEMVKS